jgi:NCAIR mutase (PurE)-related protein
MDRNRLEKLLESVANGGINPAEACEQLKNFPYQDLGFAVLDSHRALRQGLPEVIYCPGKSAQEVIEIFRGLKAGHDLVIASRADQSMATTVLAAIPEAVYFEKARLIVWGKMPSPKDDGLTVGVITAGTADIPVAEETALFLQASGVAVERVYDIGVAGIHRVFSRLDTLRTFAVTIVVAGMDGALPSVIAGLLEGPVIAVPTSVGYGTAFGGIAPLLTMLNSCAAGLTVVNIDNGFGAAVAAIRQISSLQKVGRKIGQETKNTELQACDR